MRDTRSAPGGLRMQMVVGLCLLLFVAFLVKGEAVERLVARVLYQERVEDALSIADVLTEGRWSSRDLEVVSATHGAHGLSVDSGGEAIQVGSLNPARELPSLSPTIFEEDGERYVGVTRSGTNAVVVVLPLATAGNSVGDASRIIRSFFASEAVLILLFAYAFLTFLVMRPLRAIGVATERASDGDLASPITILPTNEFGDVGRAFNSMLKRLEEQRRQLEERLNELRLANEEIRKTQDELIRSEKLASVGQLAAGIAHEIGNPLAAIAGYNELLQDGGIEPEDVDDILRRTGTQLERIQSIIRSLLDYSREDSSELEPEMTSLRPVVDEAIRLVSALPRAREVEFVNTIPNDLKGVAVAPRLSQVIVNLLVNAVDAMDRTPNARVEVSVDRAFDGAAICVRDSGPGIRPELLSRIFDPFFTTKEPGQGTGLGLAISQRIVEDMGGRLTAHSGGDGASFTIRLRQGAP